MSSCGFANFIDLFYPVPIWKPLFTDTYEIRKTEKELAKALFRPSKPEIDHPGWLNLAYNSILA